MGTLIAEWIGTAMTFFAAVLFLKFYYTAKTSRFYKKKWVVVVCSLMMLYPIIGITNAYRNYTQGRPTTKGELQEAIAANNTLVNQDFVYNSPDGYTLVVPAGYAYTTFSSGAISLAALKKQPQSSTQSAIAVAKQQGSEELESLVEKITRALKNKNSTYAFSSETALSIGEKKAIKVDVDVEKEGIPIKGIFVFAKAGNSVFSLMMSCPASLFSQESPAFERVIGSLRLR